MSKIIELKCPQCGSLLWIDLDRNEIVKSEKVERKADHSLEDLLIKEQEKKAKVDQRLQQMKSLLEAKKKKAAEIFEQSLKKDKRGE